MIIAVCNRNARGSKTNDGNDKDKKNRTYTATYQRSKSAVFTTRSLRQIHAHGCIGCSAVAVGVVGGGVLWLWLFSGYAEMPRAIKRRAKAGLGVGVPHDSESENPIGPLAFFPSIHSSSFSPTT